MAEHLISLKRKRGEDGLGDEPEHDYFPVSMHLGKDEIEALGFTAKELGDTFEMSVIVKVQSISASSNANSEEDHRHMTLDVLEGSEVASTEKKSNEEQASILFGSS